MIATIQNITLNATTNYIAFDIIAIVNRSILAEPNKNTETLPISSFKNVIQAYNSIAKKQKQLFDDSPQYQKDASNPHSTVMFVKIQNIIVFVVMSLQASMPKQNNIAVYVSRNRQFVRICICYRLGYCTYTKLPFRSF